MLTRYVVRGQIEVSPQLLAAAEVNPTPAHRCEPGALKPVVVQSARRVDASSRWHLPVALGRPLALAVDTSAVLAALPGRVIELVTVAEQTLTALCAVVVRTNALLDRADGQPPGGHHPRKRRRCSRAPAGTAAAARRRGGSPGDPPAGTP